MVEEHSPEFIDIGEKQKIDFFEILKIGLNHA